MGINPNMNHNNFNLQNTQNTHNAHNVHIHYLNPQGAQHQAHNGFGHPMAQMHQAHNGHHNGYQMTGANISQYTQSLQGVNYSLQPTFSNWN
jgi:hypothetical protein